MALRMSLGLAVFLLTAVAAAQPQPDTLPQRFTSFAVSVGGPLTRPVATPLDIQIDRWSTEAETQRLIQVLKEQGTDALVETLRELRPVGSIRTPAALGYDLRYAQHYDTQPISLNEVRLADR